MICLHDKGIDVGAQQAPQEDPLGVSKYLVPRDLDLVGLLDYLLRNPVVTPSPTGGGPTPWKGETNFLIFFLNI